MPDDLGLSVRVDVHLGPEPLVVVLPPGPSPAPLPDLDEVHDVPAEYLYVEGEVAHPGTVHVVVSQAMALLVPRLELM